MAAVPSLVFLRCLELPQLQRGLLRGQDCQLQVRHVLPRAQSSATWLLFDAEKIELAYARTLEITGPRAARLYYDAYRLAEHAATDFDHSSSRQYRARATACSRGLLRPHQLLAYKAPFRRRRTHPRRAPPTHRAKMFAPAGPEPIVAIKAGKCKVEPHRDEAKRAAGKLWITPQKDRGEVIVVKKDDVNHFQWRSREMPCAVDPNIDTMVFPGADPA